MTPVGYFFLPLVVLCSFTKPERLLSLLVLASVFEASSVFNSASGSSELGVPPFHVVEIFIALRLLVIVARKRALLPDSCDTSRKYLLPLLLFWGWATASAFTLPHIFAGMPVYEPRTGIDEQYEALTALRWSFSNLAQALYLTLNVCTVIYAVHVVKTRRQVNLLLKTLGAAVGLAVVAGGLQRFAISQGWSFPYEILNNNPGYSQGYGQTIGEMQRINSTFTEASFAGSFLAAMAVGLVAAFLRGRRSLGWVLAALAVFLVLLDTTATNGYVAFAVVLGCLFLYFSPFRGPQSARSFLARGWLVLVVPLLGIAGLVGMLSPSLTSAAFSVTAEKSDTLSFLHRVYADLTALAITANTWGLGVGLGSNRPSSMLMALLSTVGIVGTILFALFVLRIVRAFPGKSAPGIMHWTFWALICLLVTQVVAVPDINRPVLWALIVVVVAQLNVPFRRATNRSVRLVVDKPPPAGAPLPLTPRGASLTPSPGTAG